jgi:hypothetical protein
MISARLDVESLKEPQARASFLERFTMLWEVSKPGRAASIPTVQVGQPMAVGINAQVLANLQNLKLGGS